MSEIAGNAIRGMRYGPAYRGERMQGRSNVFADHAFDRHNGAPTIKPRTRNKNRTATYASPRNASFPFPFPLLRRRATPRNSLKPVEILRLCRHVTTNENNVGACIYERHRLYAPAWCDASDPATPSTAPHGEKSRP